MKTSIEQYKTFLAILVIFVSVGGYIYPRSNPVDSVVENVGAALPQGVALFQTSLQSRILSTDNSMTLTDNSVRGGSSLSGFNCFTIDEGKAEVETVCGTVSGTSVTNLQRGIDPSNGTSTNTILRFDHRRGAIVKITDFPLIQIIRNQLSGDEYIDDLLLYSSTTSVCGVGTASTTLCPKGYIDGITVSGAPNADETTKGIIEVGTALEQASSTLTGGTGAVTVMRTRYATDTPQSGCAVGYTGITGAGCSVIALLTGKIKQTWIDLTETFTWRNTQTFASSTAFNATSTFNGVTFVGQFAQYRASTTINALTTPIPVFVATATNALWISDANVATSSDFFGFATSSSLTNGATGTVQFSGIVSGFTGLTAGLEYYVQDTAGTIGTTVGTNELYVGRAVSATQLLLDGRNVYGQFLGSQSCGLSGGTCTTAAVPFARFARVQAIRNAATRCSGGNSEAATYVEFTVYKIGMSTSIWQGSHGCAAAGNTPSGYTSFTVVFNSNNTVTITGGGDSGTAGGTQTVYFYR